MQFSKIFLAATVVATVQAANASNGSNGSNKSSSSGGGAGALYANQGMIGAGLAAAGAAALLL